jgi:hypothetical protein
MPVGDVGDWPEIKAWADGVVHDLDPMPASNQV